MYHMLRELETEVITRAVADAFIQANTCLPKDILKAINDCAGCETNALAASVLETLQQNVAAAKEMQLPICQDTGMAVVFLDIGQDLHIVGGDLYEAVNAGVRRGYIDGLLRKSVVCDPLRRNNTGDNTPAVIHTRIVPGDKLTVTAAPKGFGSENMSGVRMLVPAAGRAGVVAAVLDIVKQAGSNPCPPMVVGVGIGGDFEQVALLAKRALCRPIDSSNTDRFYAQLEQQLLEDINRLGIGPQGFGGDTTALGVNVEFAPTHIAGLPVAVNIGCHVTRHKTVIL